jgi:cysteine synthase A
MRFAEALLNKKCGGSTGTNLYAAFQKISEMKRQGQKGSVVTLICDSGERYLDTYYNDQWLTDQGFDITPTMEKLTRFYETGMLK